MDIQYLRYSPSQGDNLLTANLVECYRDVFADRPWYEWLKCPVCNQYWGLKDKAALAQMEYQHCGQLLQDFWSRSEVLADLYHEITPEASGWLALDQNSVIGFCWGYPITTLALETKLQISFEGKLDNLIGSAAAVAYQDEVGVISAYRGLKIAKTMVLKRLEDFEKQGLQVGVVRTRQSPEPSETFLWYTQKLGYEVLAEYPTGDGRVVLFRTHEGLKELLRS